MVNISLAVARATLFLDGAVGREAGMTKTIYRSACMHYADTS